jgi:hypothetical protein
MFFKLFSMCGIIPVPERDRERDITLDRSGTYPAVWLAMNDIDRLILLSERYGAATGLAEATVSSRVFNDGKRLYDIRRGSDVGVQRIARAMLWFSANWPAGAAWPDGIERPAVAAAADLASEAAE